MNPGITERRFLFRGHAVPLAGRIRRPNDLVIEAQAPSSIAIAGGRSSNSSEGTTLHGMVTYAGAASSAEGEYQDLTRAANFTHGNHAQNDVPVRTYVSAELRGLKVTITGPRSSRTLEADLIALALSSHSKRDKSEPSIQPERAVIRGLKIDGKPLDVDIREKIFCDKDTSEKLRNAVVADDPFFAECGHMFSAPEGGRLKDNGRKRGAPEAGGRMACTLVHSVKWTRDRVPDVTIDGNVITVPELGVIYLGEMFVTRDSRRVTMLRVHLGSPDGGELVGVDGETNGHEWPPPR